MKKAIRIITIIAVIGLIFAAIIASTTAKPSNAEKVWVKEMTIGNLEAKNYFIIYSDLVCPYCVAFENAILEHEEEFQQYLNDNDILLEIRLSDCRINEHMRIFTLTSYSHTVLNIVLATNNLVVSLDDH